MHRDEIFFFRNKVNRSIDEAKRSFYVREITRKSEKLKTYVVH